MRPDVHQRRAQRSQCGGKTRYRDRELATRVRHSCENARGSPLRVYECPFCRGFHLTSQEERR